MQTHAAARQDLNGRIPEAATGKRMADISLGLLTGVMTSDLVQWISQKNAEWMDHQGGNFVFAAELSLMFLSLASVLWQLPWLEVYF